MSATIIDGKAIAARVRAQVADDVRAFTELTGRTPGLATVLVGGDPGSIVYVGAKQRACAEAGMTPFDRRLPTEASFEDVAQTLSELNADPAVSGILLQLPVPEHLDGTTLTGMVDPGKDVDGLTPVNAGRLALGLPGLRPCTPLGVIELLRSVDTTLEGAEAVVVGRSHLFGKPMAQLLLAENATVTVCHSRTRDLREVCARADVLIAAVGRPRLIEGEFVKPGAVVIDVGMNRLTPEEARQQERTGRRRRLRRRGAGRLGDHAGARGCRSDDDRLSAAQHAAGGTRSGGHPMSLRRLRLGELIALAGAICVIVSLFERWYENAYGNLSAWDTFGPAVVLLIAAAAAALALVVSTITERSTALPVAAAVWSTLFGIIAVIAAVVRVLERPDHATSVCIGAWLALAGAILILVGSWQSLRDERTSLYEPARPAPLPPP